MICRIIFQFFKVLFYTFFIFTGLCFIFSLRYLPGIFDFIPDIFGFIPDIVVHSPFELSKDAMVMWTLLILFFGGVFVLMLFSAIGFKLLAYWRKKH